MPRFQTRDVSLYYQTQGTGEALMLIAGLASDSRSWLPVIPELARHHRLVLPDNRGVGRTSPPDAPIDIGTIAEDCIALIEHLALGPVHLLGHSMGGLVALEMAARHPQQVGSLILAGTAASICPRNRALFRDWAESRRAGLSLMAWFRGLFYWLFSPRLFDDPAALRAALQAALDDPYPQSPDAFARQVEAMAAYDGNEATLHIGARTLVIAASDDILFPPTGCAELAGVIREAELVRLDGAAHAMHWEQPGAFCRRVIDFLHRSDPECPPAPWPEPRDEH